MTRLILVRHGETAWNADLRFQGQSDIELSERGKEQARLTAGRLAGERINAAYASDLCRCSETARLILEGRDVPLELRPELREMNFGEWEGLTFEQINAHSPGAIQRMRSDLGTFRAPAGEAWSELDARVGGFLEEALARHPYDAVLIAGHTNPLRALIIRLLGGGVDGSFRFYLYNCSVSIFEVNSTEASMLVMNDTCHIGDRWP